MPDWKDTLDLPRTTFPMKASLQATEPRMLAHWAEMDLYGRIRASRKGQPKFVLHDGPPYANGRVHIGTALNKVLKDFIVKSKTMAGYDAPYVPGWDCHGLPIELKVDRELGPKKRAMTTGDFRRECRRYAERFVDIQRKDFTRLGIFGSWNEPYLTMNYAYQASIVRALGGFVEQGLVYKGKKPVHWCIHCRTALAEAEVEYEPHTSPSIYVEFPLAPVGEDGAPALYDRVPALRGKDVSALIWTTTPWTIPSNLALAFHPEHEYGVYPSGGTTVIVAIARAAQVGQDIGRPLGQPIATFSGRLMDRTRFRHPLYDRESVGVLADYVTLDQGTGVVHTAPGHGADDFATGVQYGLEIYAPVDHAGHFAEDVPLFGGLRVFDANPRIEEALAERGRLWGRATLEHSYPHCWRCHNPVIFLATWQWFIRMDAHDFRNRTLKAITKVNWLPSWGEERIHNMVATRPDWCISRQRAWGVPIPALYCTGCREPMLTVDLTNRAAEVFERLGADAWYDEPLKAFLPEGLSCPTCGGTAFERERDILDVWFDSGSSNEAVLAPRPDLTWPADIYLEGTDQYRGWFQSSLLVGVGLHSRAPYRGVVTHGFVVDESGRKMSKSLGNVVEPEEVINQSGSEIIRLWVAMVDYREEVRVGREILARVVEAYRKFRNTFRYLVSNLYDFDPAVDAIGNQDLLEVDRYALARYGSAAGRILEAYRTYDYPTIFHTLNTLLTVDLSAFYLDVSKDRLYTVGTRSLARRSAQTAIFRMADGLTRLIAPILPVTADELWAVLPGRRLESVHLATFPAEVEDLQDEALTGRWARLIEIRDEVNKALEGARQQKVIGNSLAARVDVRASGATAELLERYRDDLPMLFIVSQVKLERSPAGDGDGAIELITVHKADGVKCQRCWRFVDRVAADAEREGLCDRCVDALAAADTRAAR
jgi:isoleucyl-tRNA synthetase